MARPAEGSLAFSVCLVHLVWALSTRTFWFATPSDAPWFFLFSTSLEMGDSGTMMHLMFAIGTPVLSI